MALFEDWEEKDYNADVYLKQARDASASLG
jgi:hypothetical protein